MIVLVALLGCPKPATPPVEGSGWIEVEEAREPEIPVESGEWRGDGVSLWVAPGWSGIHTQGDPETLLLTDSDTETVLTVQLGPTDLALPRGCDAVFEDVGSYRTVALTELRTASCVEEDGTLVQVWTGRAEFVAVRLVARYPLGQAVRGRMRVEEMLPTISPAGGA